MGHIGRLSAAKKRLDDLEKSRKQLSNDLKKARVKGDERKMKEIQDYISACEGQIRVAEAMVNDAAEAIPKRF